MKTHVDEQTVSIWQKGFQVRKFPKILEDLETDVCIVGGGVAGLTTAYMLSREGLRVCVVEAYEIGHGQTGRTTAQFSNALDYRYYEIERKHGSSGARLAAESHTDAITRVRQIVRDEKIECELEELDGYLFSPPEETPQVIYDEFEATQRAGLDTEIVEANPLKSFNSGMCLRFSRQLQLHPLKYIDALAERIVERGGQIFAKSHVAKVQGGKDSYVKTDEGHTIRAKSIVIATHTPINDLFALHTKQAAYRTYVIGLHVPKDSVPRGLYWDTLDPYHYIRLESDSLRDTLIVGGEDHKTGQNDDPQACFDRLEEWARARFPQAQDILYQWSGQIMEPIDGLAYLGHNPSDFDNVYVMTGDSGNGMTHATIGAMIITDQIMGRENPWEDLYSPSRISLRAVGAYISENANAAAQMGSWFTGSSYQMLDELPLGEGTVVRRGLQKVAAYKRLDGEIEFLNAACPHLGCVVTWNTAEKSWDCPCHGSQFNCHGKVLEGPASTDLKPIEMEAGLPPRIANEILLEEDRERPVPIEVAGDLLIT